MINLFLVLWMCVVAVFGIFCLAPKLKEKTRMILFVIGVFAVFAMALTIPSFRAEPNGKALTELSSDGVYFTEWVHMDDYMYCMKLNLGEKTQSLYYEIEKERLLIFGEEIVPAKFKVLTDKEGGVYALKPMD